MIKVWWDFEKMHLKKNWSSGCARAGKFTPVESLERIFTDPRARGLAGLRLLGVWKDPPFTVFREHAGNLSGLVELTVLLMSFREKELPLRYLLETFPGLEHLVMYGSGSIEPVRHGFLKHLALHTRSRSESDGDGADIDFLEVLSQSVFPRLETLKLSFRGVHPDGIRKEQLQTYLPPILTGETFPQLECLGLTLVMDENLADWFTETILACETPSPRLKTLDFSWGRLRQPRFLERLQRWEPYQCGQVVFNS